MSKQKIVTNGMVALAIMLFVLMFITGKKVDEQQAADSKEQATNTDIPLESAFEMDEHAHADHYESQSQSEVDLNTRPLEDAPDDERTYTLQDYFTADDIARAKEIATTFATTHYQYNGADMHKHIQANKERMTVELFDELLAKNTGRATNSAYQAEIKQIDVTEAYDQVAEKLVFMATIEGEVLDYQGNLFEKQSYVYYLQIEQEMTEFKVSDIRTVKVDAR